MFREALDTGRKSAWARSGLTGCRLDLGIAAVCLVAGMLLGHAVYGWFLRAGSPPNFYQFSYGPAVMWACGKGFVDPGVTPHTPLWEFLNSTRDDFSCRDLPELPAAPRLDGFQRANRYLLATVAFYWRLFGISWSGLGPLLGLFCGLFLSLVYGIFRISLGRAWALFGIAALSTSRLHLFFLPTLRDYPKAAFAAALILILLYLVSRPVKPKRVLALAAVYGAVMGAGYGFRTDLLIYLLPFPVAVIGFLPGRLFGGIKLKLAALSLMAACFLLSAAPIIDAHRSGNNDWHVILVGLMTPYDVRLGVGRSVYDVGHLPLDTAVEITLNGHAARQYGSGFMPDRSTEYARYGYRYYTAVVRNFPADFFTRALAAAVQIARYPYTSTRSDSRLSLVNQRNRLLSPLARLAPAALLLALLLISARNPRLAFFLTFLALYVGGYPALQFQQRHYFYLEFMGWWGLAWVMQQSFRALKSFLARRYSLPTPAGVGMAHFRSAALRGMALFAVSSLILVLGTQKLLRCYQQRHVSDLITACLAEPRERLPYSRTFGAEGATRIAADMRVPLQRSAAIPNQFFAEYLLAEFDASRFGPGPLSADLKDTVTRPEGRFDMSRRLPVGKPLHSRGLYRLMFPVFFGRNHQGSGWCATDFVGLQLSTSMAAGLTGLYRIADTSRLPFFPTLILPPDWKEKNLYQTMTNP